MSQSESLLSGLERQRIQLEQQISELQQSLYKWRVWDAEFDGLKEELSALDDNSSKDDVLSVAREFGGSLVTEDEIRKLLGESQGVSRTRAQVIDVIGRRVDYVRENIKVLEKRVGAAEDKLSKILIIEQPSEELNEDGLPMTDIVEELNDEGEVVSGSTTTPGKSTEEILNTLKKAGIELNKETGESEKAKNGPEKELMTENATNPDEAARNLSIAEDKTPSSISNAATAGSSRSSRSILDTEEENEIPVSATNDSPEDAALRREILQYGLEEVGAVVAELELDDSASEFSISDEESYNYKLSDEDEDEDEYGRTTRRVISEDYHQQMRELEKKLNAKSLHNIGPDTSVLPPEIRLDLEKPALKHQQPETQEQKPTKKKKVAFAEELDIAPEPDTSAPLVNSISSEKIKATEIPAIQDAVIEHSGQPKNTSTPESKPKKKASRFKNSRTGEKQVSLQPSLLSASTTSDTSQLPQRPAKVSMPLPLFPAKPAAPKPFSQPIEDPERSDEPLKSSNTIVDKLVEREVSGLSAPFSDPDDLDEELLKREVASEFYKLRNRKIQEEGGFMQEDEIEPPIVPIDGSAFDKPRISRFKAARVKGTSS